MFQETETVRGSYLVQGLKTGYEITGYQIVAPAKKVLVAVGAW
jgi:hypothetical protein